MCNNWLLAEPDDILEVVCLSSIGLRWTASLPSDIVAIHHKGALALNALAKAELLWLASLAVACLVEVDQISWSEIHVLHVSALLLVCNVHWRDIQVLVGDCPLEN